MNNIRLVFINEEYLEYLRKFDEKVPRKKVSPYCGIVLQIGDINFYAPLSSPKDKHKDFKDNKNDILKINGGAEGIVNIANMVPIASENYIIEIDFGSYSQKRQILLTNQFKFLDDNKSELLKRASKLFETHKKNPKHFSVKQSCNFMLLIDKAYLYLENDKCIQVDEEK